MSKFITVKLPESEKAKFKAWTNSLSAENRRECERLIVNTAEGIKRKATMFAPVDKDFLRTSLHTAYTPDRLGASVYTNRDYAPYQEFGTGSGVVAPPDVADYAMTFKGKGLRRVNNRAQPYLFPAVRIGQKEMMAKLEQMGFTKK